MLRVLGVDPGKSGALCCYERSAVPHRVVDVIDTPLVEAPIGDNGRMVLDCLALKRWLDAMAPNCAYVEMARAMPSFPDAAGMRRTMGAQTSFEFGRITGAVEALIMAQIGLAAMRWVAPQRWKHRFRLRGPDKEQSRQMALEIMPAPAFQDKLRRMKDSGRAEAFLIAFYGAEIEHAQTIAMSF